VRRDVIVVQRSVSATTRNNCVTTDFCCKRVRWDIDEETGFPKLAALVLTDIQRLERIELDFEELCECHGLLGTPKTIADLPHERRRQQYVSKHFFPWTSNSIGETP